MVHHVCALLVWPHHWTQHSVKNHVQGIFKGKRWRSIQRTIWIKYPTLKCPHCYRKLRIGWHWEKICSCITPLLPKRTSPDWIDLHLLLGSISTYIKVEFVWIIKNDVLYSCCLLSWYISFSHWYMHVWHFYIYIYFFFIRLIELRIEVCCWF